MIGRAEAVQIAEDVGVSKRPIQFYQNRLGTIAAGSEYLYIGYAYATATDNNAGDICNFYLNGNSVGQITNSHAGGGTTSETTNTIFVVFDAFDQPILGRVYFYGYRIMK